MRKQLICQAIEIEQLIPLRATKDEDDDDYDDDYYLIMVMMIIRTMKTTTSCSFYKSFGKRNYICVVGSFAFLSELRT